MGHCCWRGVLPCCIGRTQRLVSRCEYYGKVWEGRLLVIGRWRYPEPATAIAVVFGDGLTKFDFWCIPAVDVFSTPVEVLVVVWVDVLLKSSEPFASEIELHFGLVTYDVFGFFIYPKGLPTCVGEGGGSGLPAACVDLPPACRSTTVEDLDCCWLPYAGMRGPKELVKHLVQHVSVVLGGHRQGHRRASIDMGEWKYWKHRELPADVKPNEKSRFFCRLCRHYA
ncbi:hypothetical protein F5Y18DRAFT_275220 [Xylariaceae sp. FL1019]|nr:hypothetical protein F5Y18DRAFT_275220 [Xylariaceae sp. FL1019]